MTTTSPSNIATVTSLEASTASSGSAGELLTFTGGDSIHWEDGFAEDGEGGSTDLAGKTIQIGLLADAGGTDLGVPIEWRNSAELSGTADFTGLTTFDGAFTVPGWAGFVIKSGDGLPFQLNTFQWYDWGSWVPETVSVVGYRGGTIVGEATFMSNDDGNPVNVDLDAAVDLVGSFDRVEEVRIVYADGGWGSINRIGIADAAPLDTTSPSVTSVAVPASGTYALGNILEFTVAFNEAVTVDTAGGTPSLELVIGGQTVHAEFVSSPSASTLVFRYTVLTGQLDADGITLGGIDANGASIKDAAGNDATLTLKGVGATAGVLVDGVPPTVASIVRAGGSSPTNADTLTYTVTFKESVTGVSADDFGVAFTGTTSGHVAAVTGSGTTYTVTVSGVSGTGTIRLDLNSGGTGIIDQSGNAISAGYTSGQTYTIDNTVSTPTLAFARDTGQNGSDRITSDGTVNVLRLESGGSWQFSLNGGGSWTTGSGSSFTLTPGVYTAGQVLVRQTDAVGNTSGDGSLGAATVDVTAPTVAITSDVAKLKIGETALITFTFSEDPGNSFTNADIQVSGGTLGPLSGSGSTRTAVFTPSMSLEAAAGIAVAGGSYVDAAGNAGEAGTTPTLVIDTVAPTTTLHSVFFSDDTGSSQTDFVTNSAVQSIGGTLSGVLAAGDKVLVSLDDGRSWMAATATVGSATWLLSGVTLDGADTLQVKVQDAAGNDGPIYSQSYVLDTVAPAAPSVPVLNSGSDTGWSNNDGVTRDTTLTFKGTADPGSTVYLFADGSVVGFVVADGFGQWEITASSLPDGPHTLTVRAEDIAGNLSPESSPVMLTIDTTPPTVTISSNVSHLKVGESATITFTFSEDPGNSFTWDGASGDVVVSGGTLSALSGSGPTRTAVFTPDSNVNSGTASITVGEGSYADSAGNAGLAGATPSLTFDTAAPTTAAASVVFSDDSGSSETDLVTNVASQTISGTLSAPLEAGDTVYVSLNNGGSWIAATMNDPSAWSLSGQTLTGDNTLLVKVTDAAGNDGPVLSHAYTIDTTPPATTIHDIMLSSDTGSSSGDFVTRTAAQTVSAVLSGAIAPGEVLLASTDGGRNWTDITSKVSGTTVIWTGVTLAAGSSSLQLKVADHAGNEGETASRVYTLDTAAPTVETITSNVPQLKGDDSFTISVTYSDAGSGLDTATIDTGDIVITGPDGIKLFASGISVSGNVVTYTVIAPQGGWNPDLHQGQYAVSIVAAQVKDMAGNAAAAVATAHIFDIDVNTPPVLTTSSGPSSYVENGVTPVDPGITLSDPDSTSLVSATIAIVGNYMADQDRLAFTNTDAASFGNIAASFDAATGTLSLTSAGGSATLAQWQAALRTVTYSNLSESPATATRVMSFTVNDGVGSSTGTSKSVTVQSVNDAPQLADVDLAVTVTEDAGPPVAGIPSGTPVADLVTGISDSDGTPGRGIAIVGADTTSGTWWYSTDGGASWSALGTLSESHARLLVANNSTRLHFEPNADENGTIPAGLTIRAWDLSSGSNGGEADIADIGIGGTSPFSPQTDAVRVDVVAQNDAPKITVPATVSAAEDLSVPLTDIAVSDIDAGSGAVTVTLSAESGSLLAASASGVTVTGSGTGAVILTGTLTDINAYIAAAKVTFHPSQDMNGTVKVHVTVTDDGNTGAGGAKTDAADFDIVVAPRNDAPASADGHVVLLEDGTYTFKVSDFAFADPNDASAANAFAAVLIDVLPQGGAFTLDGEAIIPGQEITVADILAGKLVFTPDANASSPDGPYSGFTFRVRDNGGTADGGSDTSVPHQMRIDVTPVNDPPTPADDGPVPVIENGTVTVEAAQGVLANDQDPDHDALTVAAVAHGQGPSAPAGDPVTGTYGTLILHSDGRYSYVADTAAAEALPAGQRATDTFSYTVADGQGGTQTATLRFEVTGANDAPVFGGSAAGAVAEDGVLIAAGVLTVTDPDAGEAGFLAQGPQTGTYGTFVFDAASGAWTYELDNDAAATQALNTGETGTETFTVRALDGTAHTVSIAVAGFGETIDGAEVETELTTHPDGSQTQRVVVAPLTGAPAGARAEIPLVSLGGRSLLTLELGGGIGLVASGFAAPKPAGASLADLIREITALTADGTPDQTALANGVAGFLAGLPADRPLLVQTLAPVQSGGASPGLPLAIRGDTDPDGPQTALVLDAHGLASGAVLQLDDIDFALVIGAVTLTGGAGSQVVFADSASQRIVLGADDDTLHGGGGDDYVGSHGGHDWLYGDDGNDTVSGGEGNDRLYGGTGQDRLLGGAGDDHLDGGSEADILIGGLGRDRLVGGTGDDGLYGESGRDTLVGGAGQDRLVGGADDDLLDGGLGHDTLLGGSGHDRLLGAAGNDRLYGESGHDTLLGGDGDDRLEGGAGNDWLVGGLGRDVLVGGAGADVFDFDAVADSRAGAMRDVIGDFQSGLDRIDLRGIDANLHRGGDQAFSWTGADPAAAFSGRAGELRLAHGILAGDVDGDGRADFEIRIVGHVAVGDVIL